MAASTLPRPVRLINKANDTSDAWQVYVLRCADGTLYTGCTNDLPRRLYRHGHGDVKYTRGRLPVVLLHKEAVGSRSAALRREAAIKKMRRAQKLKLAHEPGLC
jgi:putative endonuclease